MSNVVSADLSWWALPAGKHLAEDIRYYMRGVLRTSEDLDRVQERHYGEVLVPEVEIAALVGDGE